jgi:hypothetical protein
MVVAVAALGGRGRLALAQGQGAGPVAAPAAEPVPAPVVPTVPAAPPPSTDDAKVHIEFDERSEPDEDATQSYFQPIEQLFQNPAIATGIASGADALNRSVESLMDSLFYSLLDNEQNFHVTDDFWYTAALKRDVYSTPAGAYVIVERFALGPRYAKELWRVHNVPVSLGVDGTVEVLQVYLRTDGMRVAEQEELSTWRRWTNNWFGLLPLMSAVLPPSFNQNELYDPVRQLETPFVFPLTIDGFYSMPVGSIRSYSLSGGVQLPIDVAGLLDQDSREALDRAGGLKATMPYTVFKRGEHRINVLRHGEHSAWVGLKDLSRMGHSLSPAIGNRFFILQGALAARVLDWKWVWAGVPFAVLPIDVSIEKAVADLFDQVYEYDLRNPLAQEAYKAAVQGDFVPSRDRYLDAREKGLSTGVTFHFARTQGRKEDVTKNGPNLAVFRSQRGKGVESAEVEITDQEGKFHVLEASQEVSDKTWDILVGEEEKRYQDTVEMKVKRVVDKDDPERYTFVFDTDPDPTTLTMGLNIQDRYVDVDEYEGYLEDLRYFTALPIENVPQLDRTDPELERGRRRSGFFTEPGDAVTFLHVPSTYLGRFGAQALMSFSSAQLDRIASASEAAKWAAFAKAYGLDPHEWADEATRLSFSHQARWFTAFFLYPLRLVNIRIASVDAIKEATNAIQRLGEIDKLQTPVEKLAAFRALLDTDHPERLARAFLLLGDLGRVPRRVSFSAQPKGSARHEIKTLYGKLNGVVVRGGPPFPEPGRYARAKQKLAAFYLDQPRDAEDKPRVTRIDVSTRLLPAGSPIAPGERARPYVYVELSVANVPPGKPVKLYARVEQAGRIKIGKLELAEKVIELPPAVPDDHAKLDTQDFGFYMTGPLSPLTSFLFDQAVAAGDELLVTVAASADGVVWSDDRSLEFRVVNGRLEPPRDK